VSVSLAPPATLQCRIAALEAYPDRGSATLRRVAAPEQDESFVERLSRQGEEALGKVAEELIANPVVNGAIARAFEAREKALQAQEAALGALNLPSAADIERVTRRLRSLSQRLEGIEDAIDRLEERVATASAGPDRLEARLEEIAADIARLREAVAPSEAPVPRAQERLTVTES
jgi:septal ring factor EnvC (AmiA/AmiB activator)